MTSDAEVFVKQYDEQPFKTVSIEELSEKIVERDHELELLNGPYLRLHSIKKGTQLKYPALEAVRAEYNVDDMVFGKIPIIDEEGYPDTRSNYRVFMGYIDEEHNITDGPEYHKKERIAQGRRNAKKAFNMYLKPSYLMDNYNICLTENNDYINMQKYQNLIGNLNARNMKDMFNYKEGAYLNSILTGSDDKLSEAFNDSVSNHPNSTALDSHLPLETSMDLSAIPNSTSDSSVNPVITSSLLECVDEGFSSLKTSPWSGMSEKDSFERAMLNPKVEIYDILSPLKITKEEMLEFTYIVGPEMTTEARQRMESILPPPSVTVCKLTRMRPLETAVNCLKLPKSVLMARPLEFDLSKEYEKYGYVKLVSLSNLFLLY